MKKLMKQMTKGWEASPQTFSPHWESAADVVGGVGGVGIEKENGAESDLGFVGVVEPQNARGWGNTCRMGFDCFEVRGPRKKSAAEVNSGRKKDQRR